MRLGVGRVRAAHARPEVLELSTHVRLVLTGDRRRADGSIALAAPTVARDAGAIELLPGGGACAGSDAQCEHEQCKTRPKAALHHHRKSPCTAWCCPRLYFVGRDCTLPAGTAQSRNAAGMDLSERLSQNEK